MNNALNTATTNDANFPYFQGTLGRFEKKLKAAGMKDESIAFICGRLIRTTSEELVEDLKTLLSESEMTELEKMPDIEARNKKIDSILQDKKGISLEKYQEEKLEKFVADFESKGNSSQSPK